MACVADVLKLALLFCGSVGLSQRAESPSLAGDAQAGGVYSAALMVTASDGFPLVDALVGHDYQQHPSSSPIATLRSVPPLAVRAFLDPRPIGDFRAWISANPHTAVAKLDRYVIADFSSQAERDEALLLAVSDAQLAYSHAVALMMRDTLSGPRGDALAGSSAGQPQHKLLNIGPAWDLASGWALVGHADNGIDGGHPRLQSRSAAHSTAGALIHDGPYLPHFSVNVGSPAQEAHNLLESQPQARQFPTEAACDAADGSSDNQLRTTTVGHGTHAAGLIALNPGAGTSAASGTCKGCSIAAAKISRLVCNFSPSSPRVSPQIDTASTTQGVVHLIGAGATVVNLSLGLAPTSTTPPPICDISQPGPANEDMFCLQIRAAREMDVLMVSASGNNRESALDFPARDPRVLAVGGLAENAAAEGEIWDFAQDEDLLDCPYSNALLGYSSTDQCGSNYSHATPFDETRRPEFRQELVAPAVNILSTFEPSSVWNSKIQCGDSFGDVDSSNGFGGCTGTSMSTPIVSGIAGLLRSLNPLLATGDAFLAPPSPRGVRNVLAETASRARHGLAWDEKTGFGYPNAASAAAVILGTVSGSVVRNRAIPLIRLYSSANADYADVASPQLASSLSSFQADNYTSTSPTPDGTVFSAGAPIPGFPTLPMGPAGPRAAMWVLASQNVPQGVAAPLYLLDRCGAWGGSTCRGTRDLVLTTNKATASSAIAAGYAFGGKQGFLFAPCTPEPQCIPPGTEPVYLQCSAALGNCTNFRHAEKATFESIAGGAYTESFMQGPAVIGYAFTPLDADGDGLVDGFEWLIGTSPTHADSDSDGVTDGVEYPVAGISGSDPCTGPGPTYCPKVFMSGFEEF